MCRHLASVCQSLYWKVNAGSYTSAQGSFIGSNQYQFSLGSGVNVGDTVSYYVVAEDTASPPNVIPTHPVARPASPLTRQPLATPPTTPSSYIIRLRSLAPSPSAWRKLHDHRAAVADLNSKILSGPSP